MSSQPEVVVPMAPKPSASYVPVNPEVAQRWLNGNQVNRTLRIAKVNQYANDMIAGRWTPSNDAICFAPDGRLLNGQHRLHAVIKSGVTLLILIVRNMPPGAMSNMDAGGVRSAADALGFAGEINTHLLAAAAKIAILYEDGRLYKDTKVQSVSHGEIQAFIEDHPMIRHSTSIARSVRSKIDAAPSVLAAAHWIIASTAGAAVADHYLHQLATRTGEPEGSAVLAVDSRLRQLRYKRASHAPRAYLALLIKGWNHYARDKRVASLTISTSARVPDPVRWQR